MVHRLWCPAWRTSVNYTRYKRPNISFICMGSEHESTNVMGGKKLSNKVKNVIKFNTKLSLTKETTKLKLRIGFLFQVY